jgi:hypothetical protein
MSKKKSGKNPKGMSFSISENNREFLKQMKNASEYVDRAIKEKREREVNPVRKLRSIIGEIETYQNEIKRLRDERIKIEEILDKTEK